MSSGYGDKGKDDPMRWKPKGFENHLLISEVAKLANRTRDSLLKAERRGLIPSPIRAKMGHITYRLYTQDEARVVCDYFASTKPGRKRKGTA